MDLNKKAKTIGLIFYILAALYLIYTIFTIVQVSMYLASVESSGMYVQIGLVDKISYFVTQVGPTIFYTCALFGIGYAINLLRPQETKSVAENFPRPVETESAPESEASEETNEEQTEGEFVPNPPVSFDEIDVLDLGNEEEAEEEVLEEIVEEIVEEEPVEIDEMEVSIEDIEPKDE